MTAKANASRSRFVVGDTSTADRQPEKSHRQDKKEVQQRKQIQSSVEPTSGHGTSLHCGSKSGLGLSR